MKVLKTICPVLTSLMCALCLLSLSSPAAAGAIVNGDFETGDFSGWTPSGVVYVISDSQARLVGGIGNWPTGTYVVDFGGGGGDVPDTGVITQIVQTDANTDYMLTFDYGAFGRNAQSVSVQVKDGDSLSVLNTLSISDPTATYTMDNVFGSHQMTFRAIGDSVIVYFVSTSASGNYSSDGLLDNVMLNAVPAVPAPGALLLGTVGMSLVGWLRRRRAI